MAELARFLIIAGLVLAAIGAALWLAPKIPWIGKLPGDFTFEWGRVKVYLPLATCLLLSVILTLLFSLFRK